MLNFFLIQRHFYSKLSRCGRKVFCPHRSSFAFAWLIDFFFSSYMYIWFVSILFSFCHHRDWRWSYYLCQMTQKKQNCNFFPFVLCNYIIGRKYKMQCDISSSCLLFCRKKWNVNLIIPALIENIWKHRTMILTVILDHSPNWNIYPMIYSMKYSTIWMLMIFFMHFQI